MDPSPLFTWLHEQAPSTAEARVRRWAASRTEGVIAVSACLLGIPCRYDGATRTLEGLEERLAGRLALPLCAEVLAGLGTPRPPMVFMGGDGRAALAGDAVLRNRQGRDCTSALARGVSRAVGLARAARCTEALLKARSPSCGVHQVHTDQGLIPGCGMFAAALLEAGFDVRSDEDP